MDVPDISSVLPVVEELGFGAVAGFIAGYALKKVGKLAAIVVGLFFVGVQFLAWAGYLTIEWGRVRAEVEPLLAPASLNEAWHSLLSVLTYNVPFAAAFVPAFLVGVRRG